jgi:dsRNA-specific ribonuclease
MDYRLDLYNAVDNYNQNANKDDVAIIIIHNKADGDLFTSFTGDWEILSAALTTKGYINESNTDEGNEAIENMRAAILNIAYNIAMKDETVKQKFKTALNEKM